MMFRLIWKFIDVFSFFGEIHQEQKKAIVSHQEKRAFSMRTVEISESVSLSHIEVLTSKHRFSPVAGSRLSGPLLMFAYKIAQKPCNAKRSPDSALAATSDAPSAHAN